MFLLSFVKGSKSEGGKNQLADMEPGGPNPLADWYGRGGGGGSQF